MVLFIVRQGWSIWLTRKAVGGAVVQRAVTALRVHGGFYDILGLAVVFLRELCDGGLEVFDLVDAGKVEDVVDLVCCEGGGVCGRHDCVFVWVYTEIYSGIYIVSNLDYWYGKFCGTCVTFFFNRGVFSGADRSGRWLCLNHFVGSCVQHDIAFEKQYCIGRYHLCED